MKIKRAQNGIVLKDEDDNEIVYQESEFEESDEFERWRDFLSFLTENYGPPSSRYSEKRIYISVYPGDKNENYGNEECPLCWRKFDG